MIREIRSGIYTQCLLSPVDGIGHQNNLISETFDRDPITRQIYDFYPGYVISHFNEPIYISPNDAKK